MRWIIFLIFGFFCTVARAQQASPFPADSIQIADDGYNLVPQAEIIEILPKKKPLTLHLPGNHIPVSQADKSHLQLTTIYETNDVYNGRKSNRMIPLVTPVISYIFKNGFQTGLSVGYDIHDPSPQVNQYNFDILYSINPGNGNYSSSLTASCFFYSDQSSSTTAEQKGSFEYDNSYDFTVFQAEADLSWIYGGGRDYGATFSLQHEFDFRKGKISMIPEINMNAGTQNYYDSYYHHRKYRVNKKSKKPPVYEEVDVFGDVLNAGKFQILDYEFTVPVNCTFGHWAVDFTPTYALPVNPADILAITSYQGSVISTKLVKEKLSNSFYAELGLTYSF
jgi:hypothetical protein